MSWSAVVFVTSFVSLVYFISGAIRVFRSPAYKREAKWFRAQKEIRKAAGRCVACGGRHKRAMLVTDPSAKTWEERVRGLESEGLTRSDAQAVVDAEDQRRP